MLPDNMNPVPAQSTTPAESEATSVITVRLPRSLYRRCQDVAHESRISLNKWCVAALCHAILNGPPQDLPAIIAKLKEPRSNEQPPRPAVPHELYRAPLEDKPFRSSLPPAAQKPDAQQPAA